MYFVLTQPRVGGSSKKWTWSLWSRPRPLICCPVRGWGTTIQGHQGCPSILAHTRVPALNMDDCSLGRNNNLCDTYFGLSVQILYECYVKYLNSLHTCPLTFWIRQQDENLDMKALASRTYYSELWTWRRLERLLLWQECFTSFFHFSNITFLRH